MLGKRGVATAYNFETDSRTVVVSCKETPGVK